VSSTDSTVIYSIGKLWTSGSMFCCLSGASVQVIYNKSLAVLNNV